MTDDVASGEFVAGLIAVTIFENGADRDGGDQPL
jgi:hypothetical protein